MRRPSTGRRLHGGAGLPRCKHKARVRLARAAGQQFAARRGEKTTALPRSCHSPSMPVGHLETQGRDLRRRLSLLRTSLRRHGRPTRQSVSPEEIAWTGATTTTWKVRGGSTCRNFTIVESSTGLTNSLRPPAKRASEPLRVGERRIALRTRCIRSHDTFASFLHFLL